MFLLWENSEFQENVLPKTDEFDSNGRRRVRHRKCDLAITYLSINKVQTKRCQKMIGRTLFVFTISKRHSRSIQEQKPTHRILESTTNIVTVRKYKKQVGMQLRTYTGSKIKVLGSVKLPCEFKETL